MTAPPLSPDASARLVGWILAACLAALVGLCVGVCPGCATPTHPKQCLDAPCGSCVDPRKDYGPAPVECIEEPTCVEHANGTRECFCAYTEVPGG